MNIKITRKGKFPDPKKLMKEILEQHAQDLKKELVRLSCPVHNQHPTVTVRGTKLDIENICCDELAAKINAVTKS